MGWDVGVNEGNNWRQPELVRGEVSVTKRQTDRHTSRWAGKRWSRKFS